MGRKKELPFRDFCEVVWLDAVSNDGWAGKDNPLEPEPIVSRGWLVKSEEKYITLAATIHRDSDHEYGGTQTIPRGMIEECRKLKVSNAARNKSQHQFHSQPGAEEVHRKPRES